MHKILVIEDNKNILKVVSLLLKNSGYDLKTETDGVSGVETALEWEPNLILLDLKLPKMNGFLVCETLRKNEKTADLKIIIMSAKAEEEDIKKAYNLGADEYLTKPVDPNHLLKVIKKHLNS
ncbi:MAG: response regulator [Halanaerobiales bacterium]|nr:response regulator [Halanaerobiales bacterium]